MEGDSVTKNKPLHVPSRFADLPAGWSWLRLDDACDGVFDCPHSTPKLVNAGPFVVRSQDIITGVFRTDQAARVSEGTYKERTSRVVPARGDLLYSREGTYFGIAAEVPEQTRVCLGQRMVLMRPKSDVVDFRFLCRWLNSPIMASHIHGYRDGTVAERLNLPTIRALPVLVPPLPKQRAIAHILGTLDDKIELNRRMNRTLEAMARALFKSWFVNFDGTDSKGGSDGRVKELLTLSRDTINPSSYPDERFEHYSIPAFDEGREPKTEMGGEIKSNKFLVPQNAVLLSKLNPRFPRVWLPSAGDTCRSICSTELLVAIPREGVSREYLYGLFTSSDFSEVFASLVTGTSGSHQRVKPDYLLAMEVVISPRETIRGYTEFAKPLHERIALNLKECRTLAGLRDALLPKLISGELLIPVAEKLVDGAI